jgi:hypothetical protein
MRHLRTNGQPVSVLHDYMAVKKSFASCPPLVASRASGSVVDWCVSLLRFSPWNFTVGLPRSSGGVM